jgi:hypothetical protein
MEKENSLESFNVWSRDYRARMIPVIRHRFADRGQTADEAEKFIAGACWDHPVVALRRLAKQLTSLSDQIIQP